MKTLKTGKSVNSYKRYTPVQLATIIRQLKKQFISVAKTPEWKQESLKGKKTVEAQCTAIAKEVRKVATVLRAKTILLINAKIRALKTTYAKSLGISSSKPKASSVAVKRLKAKAASIKKAKKVSPLVKLCVALKLAQFKNPRVKTSMTRTTTRKIARKTATRRTKGAKKTKGIHHYKRHNKTLKKQVHKLSKRNSFMRKLVNQFRRKVAQLKRSYRAAHAKPRFKSVKGTSNVVRFTRGTSTNWNRSSARKAG